MSALFDRVLTLNLAANTAIFYVAARLYLLPMIPRVRPQQILVPILLLHSTRHLGMMFLTRGATYPGLAEFAYPAAFGDLLTATIALVTIPIVLRGSTLVRPFGFSTSSVPLTCFWQSFWPPFTTPQLPWGPPTGFQLFGCPCCWWRTT